MSDFNTQVTPDEKTINRIKKLLNLARDGGATEGEANSAMEIAERLMLDNNLSMAQIELSGGEAQESRGKHKTKGKANYRWQRWLMTTIAEANFCHLGVITGRRKIRGGNFRDIAEGYQLIGRISNVTAAQNMYDYLLQTCNRLRSEYEGRPGVYAAQGALFVEGLAQRLSERVQERHRTLLREQREEAERQKKEQAARASHPAYAGQGNALVVVMEDFAQKEKDLNTDLFNGLAPGTTTAKRREREDRYAEQERRIAALVASGIAWDVAYYMVVMGWDQAKAETYHAEQVAADVERAKKEGKKKRRPEGSTRKDRLNKRLYTDAAWDGRQKAEDVSLSTQVADGGKNRRLQ